MLAMTLWRYGLLGYFPMMIGSMIGVSTGIVGLYRFRTTEERLHVCSAASTWICWSAALFGLTYSPDVWIKCACAVYWLTQTWVVPLGGQLWLSVHRDQDGV
jgi:hypothetical protein